MPRRYELALVVADIISAHCRGTSARARFLQTCIGTEWDEAANMVEGMLAEPWRLVGYQEKRLREFRDLVLWSSPLAPNSGSPPHKDATIFPVDSHTSLPERLDPDQAR